MELIHQKLNVKDWPLQKAGDEKFFGYVMAMGIFPREWGEEDGMTQYVDFSYNDSYERYRLPADEELKKSLSAVLWENLNGQAHTGDIYGKVWIERTENGHAVSLP